MIRACHALLERDLVHGVMQIVAEEQHLKLRQEINHPCSESPRQAGSRRVPRMRRGPCESAASTWRATDCLQLFLPMATEACFDVDG